MQAQPQPFTPITPEALKGKADSELIRLYADSGSQSAFAELVRRYARLIYATCLRETQDRTLAEDAAQGVFLLLSRKAGALKRCETLAGWLYSASRCIARNLMKQERRRQRTELQAVQEAVPQNAGDTGWDQIEPHLNDALERLKPVDREAILLRFVQEQSLAEIGACFGVPENTARMRVARALEKMRGHLSKAGIAVTIVALTELWDMQTAQAIPAGICEAGARVGMIGAAPSTSNGVTQIIKRAARLTRRQAAGLWTGTAVGCFFLTGIVVHFFSPQSLNRGEQRQLFAALGGAWQGSLEYADDKTRQHFTYPTTVTISSPNQADSLQFTATYKGTTSVDVTTFTRNPNTGLFLVKNAGPQSSHGLAGEGVLVRLSPNEVAFQGTDVSHNREVRLRLVLSARNLTMQEEYRASRWAKYEFRNRFILTK